MADRPGVAPGARLEAERVALRARLVEMERDMERLHAAYRDSNADDEHDPEGQTIADERSQLAALIVGAQGRLAELDAAATRLDEGTWGWCEVCAERISRERLEARPTARTCVQCTDRAPRGRRRTAR